MINDWILWGSIILKENSNTSTQITLGWITHLENFQYERFLCWEIVKVNFWKFETPPKKILLEIMDSQNYFKQTMLSLELELNYMHFY